jgi:hypothetical protein
MSKNKKPILVTGAHRSGTTWVGQMLCLDKNTRYIHEPFNIDEKRISPLKYWYEYVSLNSPEEKQKAVYDFINEIISFSGAGIKKDFKVIDGPKDALRFSRDIYARAAKRPLIKDPLALMSTEWLAQKFNCDVVALIRHPAAFVASLKVKNWTHSFDHFWEQKDLMEKLSPFAADIEKFVKTPPDIIEQGILLWNIDYYILDQYRKNHPDWIIIKHEDLSIDPVGEYMKIYQKLDLHFGKDVENKIKESSSASKAGHLKRDSKKNIHTWKKRLTEEEIERVIKGTESVWKAYYSEKDW